MGACMYITVNVFLFTQADGRNEGTDTDSGRTEVADFINLQTGVETAGAGKYIFCLLYTSRCV